ncbi:hypothetical protein VNO80_03162 [Phaseolus coccineus]|uniref:Uncharacterized protein n=1 Tax=Phaseolus coccineus TaxID=3886 RepID=A0AAN9NR69_PHACN
MGDSCEKERARPVLWINPVILKQSSLVSGRRGRDRRFLSLGGDRRFYVLLADRLFWGLLLPDRRFMYGDRRSCCI